MKAEVIQGTINNIVFRNEESGYTVARLIGSDNSSFTVVGNFGQSIPGETLKVTGNWIKHPQYGDQLKMENYEVIEPTTIEGIRRYLGSGLIQGIGVEIADRIVGKFGDQSLDIIETNIERLREVRGIADKRVKIIKDSWGEQREIRQVMVFLQTYGVSAAYATKIFKKYGNGSISAVKNNPYQLTVIAGIGFKSADTIAEKMGFAKNSGLRIEAGIIYVLEELTRNGHVYYPLDHLVDKSLEILDLKIEDADLIFRSVEHLTVSDKIITEKNKDEVAVYLPLYFSAELSISEKLKELSESHYEIFSLDPDESIKKVQMDLSINLAEKQIEAVKSALINKAMVITGGPGTGKTTIINSIINIFSLESVSISLAAPTGRAAKRMKEATGRDAMTIHRLLIYSPGDRSFLVNENNPLDCDVLIVDEASMIDTMLMSSLLKGISKHTTLILVGDVNQLPSVGPGNVLKDIINSNVIPVVELNEIFRQANESKIVVNAHRINNGDFPIADDCLDSGSDFYFINEEETEDILETIIDLIRHEIPVNFNFNPMSDVQVLTPMHRGDIGTQNLNAELQNILNPGRTIVKRGFKEFRQNDKVMQMKNNYNKNVFNGDIGWISRVDYEKKKVYIIFDGRSVEYEYSELDNVVLAYAVSVHKSQGSEYPVVVIPVHTQHYILLQRNLIYTAVTRGKSLVIMVGSNKAMAIGIKNDKTKKRYTRLKHRLECSD